MRREKKQAINNSLRSAARLHRRAKAYLTKRLLLRAARAGVVKAVASTADVMEYNVIAHRGHIVRKYRDGRMETITRIEKADLPNGQIIFD